MADAALRIGVDGRELLGSPTGVGRYLSGLIDAWMSDAEFPHHLTVFAPAEPPASRSTDPRITWHVLASTHSGTWWEQTTLARGARAARLDVFFAPGYTAPLRIASPLVVAIHDVSFFAHPEWFSGREGLRRRWLTRLAARRARRVVTISQFSAGEIMRWLGIAPEKIVLAPVGASRSIAGVPGFREPMVLFVGSLFNRRRLPELIEGFAIAARHIPGARLVLVGDNRTSPPIDPLAVAGQYGVRDRVSWRAYVDDAELARLYDQARVFTFLSDYEGFAITPLEAIAHHVPVVLLDTPVSREVYAEAARLVAPQPAAIGAAIAELLQDDRAHAELLRSGQRALTRYSWTTSARIVRDALETAARER